MTKVERFEDLVAWQRARSLTRAVYVASGEGRFAKDFGLSGQIQRAAVSIMSNIAEGFERYRLAEFHQFLSVAKASCAELRSQLYVARDLGYVDEDRFNALMRESQDVAGVIGALRASVEQELQRIGQSGKRVRDVESEYAALDPGLRTQDSGLK